MGNKERVSYIAIMIDADGDLESERRKREGHHYCGGSYIRYLQYNCGRFASVLLADPAA